MSHFNNTRTIDLSQYLPGVLQDFAEMQAIMSAETPIVQALWEACESCMDDQFISEATEHGLARRETMLGITPYGTDTLDDRRLRISARYTETLPYTRRTLETMLQALCGADGYTLVIETATFTVTAKVALTVKKQRDSVEELLERVLPYNMVFTVEIIYNQWETLGSYTWGQLSGMTWGEVKEEDLP